MSSPAIVSLGGYEVLAELDSGGMGEVFIARKKAVGGFERLVALKTVRGEIAHVDAAREMFLDEGRLLARLHHRGIAQVYDFGEDGDRLYLAMEYVAGVDFEELAEGAIDPGVACRAMAEAARALHAAHELKDTDGKPLGVVHRDVSPGNLMLTYDGSVKVLDFGIALMRGRRAPVTEFGMLKGKPPYMAPEQVRSEAVDPRSDVFSACAVLWELLTTRRLFTGDSIFAIGRSIESGEVAPPSRYNPAVSSELDAVVLQGLAKDPAERFQTASELAASLENVARALGAEALPDFARRTLDAERRAHEAYIAEISRATTAAVARVGRETHSHTIPAFEAADTAPGDNVSPETPLAEPEPEPESEPEPRQRRSRWPLLLSLVAGIALLGVAAWQLGVASRAPVHVTADASALIEAPLDAGIDAQRATTDAAPIKDAAPLELDAARRRTTRRKDAGTRRVVRPDAAPPPPRPDASVAGFGRITVPPVEPYVNILIDGNSIGSSPKFNRRVRAGTRVITFINPTTNAVMTKKSVTVKAGETVIVRAPRR